MALSWSKRVRLIAAWCLGAYRADMFIRMGWIKFAPEGFWTAAFARWGYPPWLRVAVGLIEVVGGRCVSTIVRQPLLAFSESSRGPRPALTV